MSIRQQRYGARVVLLALSLAAAPMAADDRVPVALEESYADLRALRDALELGAELGREQLPDGRDRRRAAIDYAADYERIQRELESATQNLTADGPALEAMRAALHGPLKPSPAVVSETAPAHDDCGVPADPDLTDDGFRRRTYRCYADAQSHVRFDGEVIDRLTVFSRLARTDDRAERRRLFLALDPVWRSVNGNDDAASPYRRLVAAEASAWRNGDSPVSRNLTALGVDPTTVERWLVELLAAWRDATPATAIEPWDLHYLGGAVDRRLDERIPRQRLEAVNSEVYRALGADPERLGIRFDLEPRDGKTPVAFTTFGRRPRLRHGRLEPGEPWVVATYREGGFGNLVELLHETGHAIHIQAIRTRPAFADWPDSDTFTEALADLVALEAYEPAWQRRWLGAAAPLAENLRSKYSAIVLDVCWALFEVRMHRLPDADPNLVWSALTSEYLHVRPHPELSWWAMRGQLVDSPGYMMNYAMGAILVADLRARLVELRGLLAGADESTYSWLSEHLYRFGLERPSRRVIEEFLGRPPSPAALLADIDRLDAATERPVLALVGGTLVDLSHLGSGVNDLPDATVLVRDGRIVAAGRRDQVTVPSAATVLDVTGRFLVPGLIDGFAGLNSPGQARAYLYSGVTTIIGVADPRRGPLDYAAEPRPRILPLESVGYDDAGNDEIEPTAVRHRIDRLAAEGVAVLLLMYPLPAESLDVAVERARQHQLATIGELGATPYSRALDLGVQAFVHTSRYSLPLADEALRRRVAREPFGPPKLEYYLDLVARHGDGQGAEAWAERLGASRTALVPTLAMEYLDLPGHANPWLEPAARLLDPAGIHLPADPETGERRSRPGAGADAFPAELSRTLLALESTYTRAGARHLAGSGTSAFGTMPGISLHHEIELLRRVGLTPREALAAATTNFGATFGWSDLGCLDPGCRADLLALGRDPTADLGALDEIELLMVDGAVVDRAALLTSP